MELTRLALASHRVAAASVAIRELVFHAIIYGWNLWHASNPCRRIHSADATNVKASGREEAVDMLYGVCQDFVHEFRNIFLSVSGAADVR